MSRVTKAEERVDEALRELLQATRAVVQDPTEADAALTTATVSFSDACTVLRQQLEKADSVQKPLASSRRPEVVTSLLADLAHRHTA